MFRLSPSFPRSSSAFLLFVLPPCVAPLASFLLPWPGTAAQLPPHPTVHLAALSLLSPPSIHVQPKFTPPHRTPPQCPLFVTYPRAQRPGTTPKGPYAPPIAERQRSVLSTTRCLPPWPAACSAGASSPPSTRPPSHPGHLDRPPPPTSCALLQCLFLPWDPKCVFMWCFFRRANAPCFSTRCFFVF